LQPFMRGAYPRQTIVHTACVRWRSADIVQRFWQHACGS
jgi:hypothetical protein